MTNCKQFTFILKVAAKLVISKPPTRLYERNQLYINIQKDNVNGFKWTLVIPTILDLFNVGGKKLVHNFNLCDFLYAFGTYKDGRPILTQMWFIRDLFLLVLWSPVVYFLVKYMKFVTILIFGMIWFMKQEVPNWESGLLFFTIGASLSVNGKSLTEEIRKIANSLFILTPLLVVADFLLNGTVIGFYVHRTLVFIGVLFIVALIAWLVERHKIRDIAFLTSGSFFLYVIHDPMIRFIRKVTLLFVTHTSDFQMTAIYFLSVAVDVLAAYVLFWCLRKYLPDVLKWTTGGR